MEFLSVFMVLNFLGFGVLVSSDMVDADEAHQRSQMSK